MRIRGARQTRSVTRARPRAPIGCDPPDAPSASPFRGQGSIRSTHEIHLPNKTAIREACGDVETFTARFELPVSDDVIYLNRTHAIVEGLASYVMDAALDPLLNGVARRCGAIRTRAVTVRTTLLLARFRYHILTQRVGAYGDTSQRAYRHTPLLAEDCRVLGFTGAPDAAKWLAPDDAEALLDARPDANITPQQASDFVRRVADGFDHLREALNAAAEQRGQEVLDAHRRVRAAARLTGVRYAVQPQLPPDVLGIFVLLPIPKEGKP
jgi:hypothetical protein